jgi:Ca2+-binding EF-hand superfamily protein
LLPVAEKPWVTFMGRQLRVPKMNEDVQKCLGIYDRTGPGAI